MSRLGLLAVLPASILFLTLGLFFAGRTPLSWELSWVPALGIELAFRIDALAVLLVALITGVGAFVFVYASGYMAGAPGRARLFGLLLVFMASMLGAVSSDNLFVLFIFWELTSVSSFLLVGFSHEAEESRKSAQQALMVTGGGGLVLLAGFILLAQISGTSSISAILATAHLWNQDSQVWMALACIFVGAFSKSAQIPFAFWLPGAMAAPTPVSAYLHSATMVKLGVYLLARLHPAFELLLFWQVTLVSVGGFTSMWAMVNTFRERDLKRILAWSTVSALGTLVLLIGLPGEGASTAAATFLLAHALYKAPLFFVAGNVDLATGTRLIDQLGGLSKRLPFTAAAALLAAFSMAGIPLSFGCLAKDIIKTAQSDGVLFSLVGYTGVFVSAASFAAAGVASIRVFFAGREANPPSYRRERLATWLPPLAIASIGVVFGLFPAFLQRLLSEAALSMGSTTTFAEMRSLSDLPSRLQAVGITLGLGVVLYVLWDRIHKLQKSVPAPAVLWPAAWYRGFLFVIPWLAKRLTWRVQAGYLRTYLLMSLGFAVLVLSLVVFQTGLRWPVFEASLETSFLVVMGATATLVVTALLVCLVRDSFVMLLLSGMIGLASAVIFLFLGAPDVAFTQLAVEVAFVVVLASILLRVRNLDLAPAPDDKPSMAALKAGFALGMGLLVAALLLSATSFTLDPSLAQFFLEHSYPEAHGRNVVNVILVDFRAMDTLGEIVVVSFTFIASMPLLWLLRRQRFWGSASQNIHSIEGAIESDTPLMLRVAIRVLYPLMLVGAVVLLLRGHNEPGGGFIAGMVAVAATALLSVGKGSAHAIQRLPLSPFGLAGVSALLSLASGLPALLVGEPYMTHFFYELPLGFVTVPLSTALLFDLGVFGAVWASLGTICAKLVDVDAPAAQYQSGGRG